MRDRLYFEDLNGDPYIMLLKVYMIEGLTDIPLLKKNRTGDLRFRFQNPANSVKKTTLKDSRVRV